MAAHVQVRKPAAGGGGILRGGSSDIHQGVVVVGYPGVFWGGGGVPGAICHPEANTPADAFLEPRRPGRTARRRDGASEGLFYPDRVSKVGR